MNRYGMLAGAALTVGLASGSAKADPQVLGIVASLEPQPLTCDESGCHADLTAFCLERERHNPLPGQVYLPVANADIRVIGLHADGSTITLPTTPYLQFTTRRGFTSIEASLDPTIYRALGLIGASIFVGQRVSLLPEADARDTDPRLAEEIALATGPNRLTAQQFYDDHGADSDALRLTSAMINSLPTGYRREDSDGRVWAAPQVVSLETKVDPAGLAEAAQMHADCQVKVDVTHHVDSMRACLEGSHDRLSLRQNIDLWNAIGGS
ncbi:hypothetical protein [Hypericibacter sp.]|uniref:hypothetical protein n=1 Tax=Hypericibacter sp. TaxID=2705401 RepID=UPI003D6C9870